MSSKHHALPDFVSGKAWCLSTCTSNLRIWWAKYGPLPRCLAAMRLTVSAGLEHLWLSLSLARKFTKLVIAVSTIINLNDRTVLQCLVSWRRRCNMSSVPASCTDPTECCSIHEPHMSRCVQHMPMSIQMYRHGHTPGLSEHKFCHRIFPVRECTCHVQA